VIKIRVKVKVKTEIKIKENKMPGLDGTGPMGQGSGTGRGLGQCNPANDTQNEEFKRPMGGAFRNGRGRGFGGRGFRDVWKTGSAGDNKGKS
jgi:uncharacterized protein DUF5320